MDKIKAADEIIVHALPLAAFEGWNQATLAKASANAGYKRTDAIRVFPGGAIEAVGHYFSSCNSAMLLELERYNLETMKIRERIALCVRLWLETQQLHREGLRRAIALQSLLFYAHHALESLYETVDTMWHAVGDTSTDFNFYTKRLMLGAVFTSTVLFWLDDASAGHENTWAFLNRRIDNVMTIEKAKYTLKNWLAKHA